MHDFRRDEWLYSSVIAVTDVLLSTLRCRVVAIRDGKLVWLSCWCLAGATQTIIPRFNPAPVRLIKELL